MYKHQQDVFLRTREMKAFALFWEMGAGKTKEIIDCAAWLYARGEISSVYIVAPNGLQRMWCEQFLEHCPDYIDYKAVWWTKSHSKTQEKAIALTFKHRGLRVFAQNVESLVTPRGVKIATDFVIAGRTLMVVDESTSIKNPSAVRTKAIFKIGRHAAYRRVLTGTPVTNNPMDVWAQFEFLDPQILGCPSFTAFRHEYCEMVEDSGEVPLKDLYEVLPKHEVNEIAILRKIRMAGGKAAFATRQSVDENGQKKFRNIEKLRALIAPYSDRVTKAECLDLPPKIYQRRYVELSSNQSRLYKELRRNIVAEFQGRTISAPLAITKLIRLQQILGGFWTPDQETVSGEITFDMLFESTPQSPLKKKALPAEMIDPTCPRLEALIETLNDHDGKAIIWSRFRPEIAMLSAAIRAEFGEDSCVEYHGGVNEADRADAIVRLQGASGTRFFVGNAQSAGKGLTLTAASLVVYYSNSFNYADRAQSEDRAHRIGQKNPVTYVDFIAEGTIDEKIISALLEKRDYAAMITGDNLEKWI
jgi:SNF2 family DNA or RNA helicase